MMVTKDLQVHVGDRVESMPRRDGNDPRHAEHGDVQPENAERHIGFDSFEAFARVMTPRRLALLRHVHLHPARSIRALAIALGRDYHRVHDDVEALVTGGLLDRDKAGLHVDYGTVRIDTRIALDG